MHKEELVIALDSNFKILSRTDRKFQNDCNSFLWYLEGDIYIYIF